MITIDGSAGEGGGQILRTSLGLALVTEQAFRIRNIRAGRAKPGLLRQHLTAVEAAIKIGNAEAEGAHLGSRELAFKPGKVSPGEHHFAVGSAGSATLVLQTVLPALIVGSKPSVLHLEGGTHNPHAPPFDFLDRVFLPLLNRMGPTVTATLQEAGFYPAGGGRFTVTIAPAENLRPLEILERGEYKGAVARAIVANLPKEVGDRELKVVAQKLGWAADCLHLETVASRGPGNVLLLETSFEHITELFTGFGERGTPAETVADRVIKELRQYLESNAPVGEHLADQLLLPLALAGGGSFATVTPSLHTKTNMDVISQFLPVMFTTESFEDHCLITVKSA